MSHKVILIFDSQSDSLPTSYGQAAVTIRFLVYFERIFSLSDKSLCIRLVRRYMRRILIDAVATQSARSDRSIMLVGGDDIANAIFINRDSWCCVGHVLCMHLFLRKQRRRAGQWAIIVADLLLDVLVLCCFDQSCSRCI